MNMKSSLLTLALAFAMAVFPAFNAFSVTDKEMDQARAIAAKNYLRYANNGSGYLDDKEYTSMAALEKDLKAKEKENIKAFKAIAVPKDYASWDKAKLVAYWSDTFFKSPGLLEEGRGGKTRTRKKIEAMNVSAPTPKSEAAPAASTTAEAAPAAAPADVPANEALTAADTAGIAESETDILADQKAIEDDKAAAASMEKEQSYTWVYVLILVLLLAVVIWLVAFAAKVMRKQESHDEGANATAPSAADLDREQEIRRLSQRLRDEQERCLETSRSHERLKVNNQRLSEQVDTLRAENAALQARVDSLTERLAAKPAPQLVPAKSPEPRRREEPVAIDDSLSNQVKNRANDDILHVIYLGRANSRGIFVRADRKVVAGHTVFRLDTEDGLVGTFHVVDLPEVTSIALNNPQQILSGGCSAKDIADTLGASGIVTENAGTAIFENGYWKVLRKSRIRYE